MIQAFEIHNTFKQSIDEFLKKDPHLLRLKSQKYVYHSPLEQQIPVQVSGIYILTGGRQVGKTTLLKLIIRRLLLEKKVDPKQIFYLPCDLLEHFQQLLTLLEDLADEWDPQKPFFLFVDEVTYVREWDRAIKSLADRGLFEKGSIVLTGSDSYLLQEAMMRFPGRRGKADETDFHLFPLSFTEFSSLDHPEIFQTAKAAQKMLQERLEISEEILKSLQSVSTKTLFPLWEKYLMTGGFLTAINNDAEEGKILRSTYQTYIQWILGDLLKRGKKMEYARELLKSVIDRLGSQVTWHSLMAGLSIEHHQTVAEYMALLERMDVLFVLQAFREDKFQGAPKKARKVHFSDPFIFHALHAWVRDEKDPFGQSLQMVRENHHDKGHFVEGVVASLAHRAYPTFYIKAEGEVDLVLVDRKRFLPIEIKWSATPKLQECKQILKYKKGVIATRSEVFGKWENLTQIPIPSLALLFG